MRGFKVARKMKDGNPVEENGVTIPAFDIDDSFIPEYQTRNSAGADFKSAEDVVVPSIWKSVSRLGELSDGLGEVKPTLIHTGIKACMEADEVLHLYNRSSNPIKLGLVLANSVGVVDADYFENESNDGEIMFAFYNFSSEDVHIKKGDRIGQGVFVKFERPDNDSCRVQDKDRVGGYGSTSK